MDALLVNLKTLRETHAFEGTNDHTDLKSALDTFATAETACGGTVDEYVRVSGDCTEPEDTFANNPGPATCFLIADTYSGTRLDACAASKAEVTST
jgi:hypothetical protein